MGVSVAVHLGGEGSQRGGDSEKWKKPAVALEGHGGKGEREEGGDPQAPNTEGSSEGHPARKDYQARMSQKPRREGCAKEG